MNLSQGHPRSLRESQGVNPDLSLVSEAQGRFSFLSLGGCTSPLAQAAACLYQLTLLPIKMNFPSVHMTAVSVQFPSPNDACAHEASRELLPKQAGNKEGQGLALGFILQL